MSVRIKVTFDQKFITQGKVATLIS